MKKPDHYLTDALVTSDEWDSFDYNLQAQIKALARIDYDSKPVTWKEYTLGFTYLHHVEELLKEKWQYRNNEIENIRELQKLIEKYDHLKTFLLAVRIATIAYRTGLIPKFIKEGEKYLHGQSKKAGKRRSRGDLTPAGIQVRNNLIVEQFKEAHRKNRGITPSGFSKTHAAKHGLKPRQVRYILSKMAVGS